MKELPYVTGITSELVKRTHTKHLYLTLEMESLAVNLRCVIPFLFPCSKQDSKSGQRNNSSASLYHAEFDLKHGKEWSIFVCYDEAQRERRFDGYPAKNMFSRLLKTGCNNVVGQQCCWATLLLVVENFEQYNNNPNNNAHNIHTILFC